MNDIFTEFIPDFRYRLVCNHDYTNEELLANEDEMSLLMMLGKAQTPEDVSRLVTVQKNKVEKIIRKAPEHLLEVISSTVWSLCMKMNIPQEEAAQYTRKVRERQMGYWFENMEKMDIQAERRNTEKARAELEDKKKEIQEIDEKLKEKNEELKEKNEELKEKNKELKGRNEELNEKKDENEKLRKELAEAGENRIKLVIDTLKELDMPSEQISSILIKKCGLDAKEAERKMRLYLQ